MKKIQSGFTLLEVMVVMFLTVTITVVGIVSLSRLQVLFQLRTSADEVKAQLQYGRQLAIANKGNAVYNYSLSGSLFRLTSSGVEVSRYQLPGNLTVTPTSFSMNFTPLTGLITSCSPCQLTLTSGDQSEIVSIQANGIID